MSPELVEPLAGLIAKELPLMGVDIKVLTGGGISSLTSFYYSVIDLPTPRFEGLISITSFLDLYLL